MKLSRIKWAIGFMCLPLLVVLSDSLWRPKVQIIGPKNKEATLACGDRIGLRASSRFDLELVPGVSSTIADEILTNRDEILRRSKELSSTNKHRALEIAKGIGEKRSKEFSRYIAVEK